MANRERIFTPGSAYEKKFAYCRVVKVGNLAFVTGTVGLGSTAAEQTRAAFKTIETALSKVGASLKDVVRTRVFVTEIERDSEEVGRVHGELFAEFPPAMSMIGIKALIDPKYFVEVEADVVLPTAAKL